VRGERRVGWGESEGVREEAEGDSGLSDRAARRSEGGGVSQKEYWRKQREILAELISLQEEANRVMG